MKVIYQGPHDGVEVPLPDGRVAELVPGEVLDTTPEHAQALLEQPSNWRRQGPAPAPDAPEGDPAKTPKAPRARKDGD